MESVSKPSGQVVRMQGTETENKHINHKAYHQVLVQCIDNDFV